MDAATSLAGWSSRPGPLHRRLATALADAVTRGELVPGHRLPSERALARSLVISRSTVVAAYSALVADGVLESRQGSGTYVAGRARPAGAGQPAPPAPMTQRLLGDAAAASVVSLASAGVPPTRRLADAVARVVQDDLVAMMAGSGYQPLGLPRLREAIAASMHAEGLATDPTQLLVTTGAHQALNICAAVLVRPGDWVGIETTTYPGCIDAFAAAGARLVPIEVDADGLVPESLERALAERTLAAVAVTTAFHNPTGALLAPHRRRRLVEIVARHGVPVVEDRVLVQARFDDVEVPPPLAAYAAGTGAAVATVGSASKLFWAGLRTGWIRAEEPWFTRLARRKTAADLGSSVFDQAVTAVLFDDAEAIAADLHAELARRLADTEAQLSQGFPGWSWTRPRGGPSLWVDTGTDAARFAQLALRHGVEVVPGPVFAAGGGAASHIRVPFGVEPDVMAAATTRLRASWAAYRPDVALDPRPEDRTPVV